MRGEVAATFVPRDTTADADARQVEAYQRLGGPGRVAAMFRLNAMVRTAAIAGIRRRHPTYDDRQVELAWLRLSLGEALVAMIFPGRELVEP